MSNWIDQYFVGLTTVQTNGAPLPQRATLNVTGPGATVADDPVNKATVLNITAGGGGGGSTSLNIAHIAGPATVAAVAGTTYEVDATGGAVTFTTNSLVGTAVGPYFEAIRIDATSSAITVDAPTGGSVQDPTTYAFGSTASIPTQNQSGAWYINGNVLRLY